jgi:Fe-S-cluster containining protein
MSLPCKECGQRCCTFPAMNKTDFKKIKKYLPKDSIVLKKEEDFYILASKKDDRCPLLDKKGKCLVYHIRPSVCRLYGENTALPCQYLYPDEALNKIKAMKTFSKMCTLGNPTPEMIISEMNKMGIDRNTFTELLISDNQ